MREYGKLNCAYETYGARAARFSFLPYAHDPKLCAPPLNGNNRNNGAIEYKDFFNLFWILPNPSESRRCPDDPAAAAPEDTHHQPPTSARWFHPPKNHSNTVGKSEINAWPVKKKETAFCEVCDPQLVARSLEYPDEPEACESQECCMTELLS